MRVLNVLRFEHVPNIRYFLGGKIVMLFFLPILHFFRIIAVPLRILVEQIDYTTFIPVASRRGWTLTNEGREGEKGREGKGVFQEL